MMEQPESDEVCSAVRLHYDSPASSYKKGGSLVPSPSYLSPKSKAFLRTSEKVGDITPPTSKASSSPGDCSPISNNSRKSSTSGIDHTALLLGLHVEFEDESDDEAKHCCFSPMASMDALDGVIDSDDDDETETVGSDGPPLQLAMDTANRGAVTVSYDNTGDFNLSLVARQLEVQGRITKAGCKSKDTLLKAAAITAKASSEFSAKAQKAKKKLDVITPKITLPPVISSQKSEQRINDELSAASNKGKLAAKHASEMITSMKDKAAQKAHKVKDMTLEVVGRKTYHKTEELSHNGSEALSLLSDDVGSEGSGSGSATATKRALKLPNLPRPPKTLSLKKGYMNKKFMSSTAAKRTQSKDTIDQKEEQHFQSAVCSLTPSSIISPTNSYDVSSCIDADGFLLSPQSSLGFISPTASIDEYGGMDGNLAFGADGFVNFETSSIITVRSNTDEDGELLSKELKAAIQTKTRKPALLPPSGRPRQK